MRPPQGAAQPASLALRPQAWGHHPRRTSYGRSDLKHRFSGRSVRRRARAPEGRSQGGECAPSGWQRTAKPHSVRSTNGRSVHHPFLSLFPPCCAAGVGALQNVAALPPDPARWDLAPRSRAARMAFRSATAGDDGFCDRGLCSIVRIQLCGLEPECELSPMLCRTWHGVEFFASPA